MNLGEFLVKEKVISQEQLGAALALNARSGCDLPQILLAEGFTGTYPLYTAIARFEGVAFADLSKTPCDRTLLFATEREYYIEQRFIPWMKDGNGTVVIAACQLTGEVTEWANTHYGKQYRVAITSPFDIYHAINTHFAEEDDDDAREKLWRKDPASSAKDLFTDRQHFVLVAVVLAYMVICYRYPHSTLAYSFLVVNVFYIATLLFKTVLFAIGWMKVHQAKGPVPLVQCDDVQLPIYTILVPMYQEDQTVGKMVNAIRALDYPKSKLDVKLIVEEDDAITISAIKALQCERMFEMIKVPKSQPRTKPKACNYALRFARGEYITIYDAEDIPDPAQLKKVLYVFAHSDPNVMCVQAKLNYFNRDENLLTRLFAIEYASLFDFTLPGLEALNIPIPLGGTSNHFKASALQTLYAWDPYNVTEDADLGIRLAQKGWKVGLVDSLTLEEAPITLGAWIRQRSRWIKGHMQTYLVHMRRPLQLLHRVGPIGFLGFQMFLGAPALVFLISPIMWGLWTLFMANMISLPHALPAWFNSMIEVSFVVLVSGFALPIVWALLVIFYHRWRGMWSVLPLVPLYWLLHSVASFKSLWQLITRPHYWEKTTHGLSRFMTSVESRRIVE